MKALTAVAATVYAVGLWMFAPQSRWEQEVQKARRNQQNRLNPTPEPTPQPEPITETEELLPDTVPDTVPDTTPTPEPATVPTLETFTPDDLVITETEIKELLPDTIWIEPDTSEPQQPDYSQWTITQLRELAKQRKLNWRPLTNGKRKPLNKPQLIALLTA